MGKEIRIGDVPLEFFTGARKNDELGNNLKASDVLCPPAKVVPLKRQLVLEARRLRKMKKPAIDITSTMGRGVSLRDITNPSPITPKDNRVTPKRKYK